jgi:hypothetical protein
MVRPNGFRAAIMTEIYTTRTRCALWAVSVVTSALVLVGFGTYAYSAHFSAAAQERLYHVIAELTANQMQLIAERDEVAGYLNAAREALALVGSRLESANAERDAVKVQWAPPREGSVTCERRSVEAEVSRTGTLRKTLGKAVPLSRSELAVVSATRSSDASTPR